MKLLIAIVQWVVTAVALAFIILLATAFLPFPGAFKMYSVRSGSMEPTIHTGSLIFVRPMTEYQVGDIITVLTSDKQSVTHRIIRKRQEKTNTFYLTKGDSNEDADPSETAATQVVGKTLFSIPWVGYPVAYAQTKRGFLALIVVPALLIIAGEVITIAQEVRRLMVARRSAGPSVMPPLHIRYTAPPAASAPAAFIRPGLPPLRPLSTAAPLTKKRKIV